MSNNTQKAKTFQLGMPFATARQRLIKALLFDAVCKLNQNVCFKCSKQIEKIEDFTIEHKQPWLHVSADLFWNLNNIAFSHFGCNRPDRPELCGVKQNPPEGMNWCYRHKKFLPVENFCRNETRKSGWHNLCNECAHYTRKNKVDCNGLRQ